MDISGQINVSVANLYRSPKYHSEVVSQVLLGECFEILKNDNGFTFIRLSDGYEGWVSKFQWVEHVPTDQDTIMVRSHFLRIFDQPSIDATPLRDAVIGVYLPINGVLSDWYQVGLPDGKLGWAEKSGFGKLPSASRTAVVQLAREFLGYPYYWGGRSPKGFDCSGLTQTVFSLFGISIPRDSWMQHRDGNLITKDPLKAKEGDLYFFADRGQQITHVGIALGGGKILHARGMVRLNSLLDSDDDYSDNLWRTLVDIRTYL
jgi:hypothetical protein